MWRGFGWRSWCESQSRAGSSFLPGESDSVSCFLAGTGSGGVNRGNPTRWRGNSTVPSYTHPAGTLSTPPIHTRMNALLPHISPHVHAQGPSCPHFETMDFHAASGTDKHLNRICSLKISALFRSLTSAHIHFWSFVLECVAWSVVIYVCACCDGLCLFDREHYRAQRKKKKTSWEGVKKERLWTWSPSWCNNVQRALSKFSEELA